MKKCPYCEKETNRPQSHIYKCDKRPPNHSRKRTKKAYMLYNYPYISREKTLRLEYEEKRKSLPDLKKEFGISYSSVTFLLDEYKIKRRSISEGSVISKKKYKKTCMKKYGAENALSKGTSPYKKRNETVKSRYGINNVFELEEVKKKITESCIQRYGKKRICNPSKISETKRSWSDEKKRDVAEKISKAHISRTEEEKQESLEKYIATNQERYGVDFSSQLESVRISNRKSQSAIWKNRSEKEKTAILSRLHNIRCSNIEARVNEIIFSWGIKYEHSFYFKQRQFDFKIEDLLLEVNGDFYHANPKKYKPDDIVMLPKSGGVLAMDIWEKDLYKKMLAKKAGFRVVYIWENEIKNISDKKLDSLLQKIIFRT